MSLCASRRTLSLCLVLLLYTDLTTEDGGAVLPLSVDAVQKLFSRTLPYSFRLRPGHPCGFPEDTACPNPYQSLYM